MFGYIKKFINFAGDQKKYMISALILGFFQSAFAAANIMACAYVLQAIINGTATKNTAWQAFGIVLVGIIGAYFCNYFSVQFQTRAGYITGSESRIRIADKLRYVPMGYFNQFNLGQITNTATNVAELLQETLTRCMLLSVQGVLTTIVITVCMFILDWRIGWVTLAGFGLFLLINRQLHKAGERVSQRKLTSIENLVSTILEYVQGIAVIKSYNLVGGANQKVSDAIAEEFEISYKLERTYIPYMSLQRLAAKLFSVLIVGFVVWFTIGGSMDLGTALTICIASYLIYDDLSRGGNMSSLLRIAAISIDQINAVMEMPVMDENGRAIEEKNKDIAIQNVTFSYEKRRILNDVSVDVPIGSTLAIVGSSGSGKTTLTSLIVRFWDADSGSIRLGNHDVRDYTLDSLLKNYSMSFQNVYLFNDTIRNNISFGSPNASLAEIRDAAQRACCDDFIMQLPDGYDTMIGEGGASISGGEKQRISIARAILKDAPIIILDEATANVDPENEWMLQNAIQALTATKTVILIAHRIKTVRRADQIIVLDEGKIVEQGTHDQLIAQDGQYAEFINMREQSIGWKLGRREDALVTTDRPS